MCQISENQDLKYNIKKYVNTETRNQIIKELKISKSTYYAKEKSLIGQKGGFEVCELHTIATILERSIDELITKQAIKYYSIN